MTNSEFFQYLTNVPIAECKVAQVQSIYHAELPEIIQKIVSCCEEPVFLDNDIRILSLSEILNAEEELHVPFVTKKILPIADCCDNDFIVYHLSDHSWSRFNIVDETSFMNRNHLEELLK